MVECAWGSNPRKRVRLPAKGGRKNAGRLQADERLCGGAKRRQSLRAYHNKRPPLWRLFIMVECVIKLLGRK